jgi:K+-sensing histidine kinase KdpD
VLSAVLAGLGVAVVTSIVATLLFNYFFFPPVGTFAIADFHNWVALFAFLFTSIVISRLTSSALENIRKAEKLEMIGSRMKVFFLAADRASRRCHFIRIAEGYAPHLSKVLFPSRVCGRKVAPFFRNVSRNSVRQIADNLKITGPSTRGH